MKGQFLINSQGFTYWSSTGEAMKSPKRAPVKAAAKKTKDEKPAQKKQDKKESAPAKKTEDKAPVVSSGDHVISSVESTEAFLTDNGIKFKVSIIPIYPINNQFIMIILCVQTQRHEVTPTNAVMKEVVKWDGEYSGAMLAKQLFLFDKKKKENMWLICAGVDTEVDMKGLNKYLPVGSGNLRGADLESLEKYLGCR